MPKHKSEIPRIEVRDCRGFYTFQVVPSKPKPRLVADFRTFLNGDRFRNQHVNFTVSESRLIKLARDILNYYGKKMKLDRWKPTFEDFEKRLEEIYGEEGFYMWIVDWLRNPRHKDVAERLYDWLKTAEELGMFE